MRTQLNRTPESVHYTDLVSAPLNINRVQNIDPNKLKVLEHLNNRAIEEGLIKFENNDQNV